MKIIGIKLKNRNELNFWTERSAAVAEGNQNKFGCSLQQFVESARKLRYCCSLKYMITF